MICNKENDRRVKKNRGKNWGGGRTGLGERRGEEPGAGGGTQWGWGLPLPHSAVRCGPQHPWHSVGTSMKRGHQCPLPRVVVGITPSASTHSLTQEEVMTRCSGNEPCSVTYTVREGVLMKVALCEWLVWRIFSKGGTLFLFAWCQPCSWAYSLSTSVECRWCICPACRWNVNKYVCNVQSTGLLFFSN